MMSSSQQPTQSLDQILFTVDTEAFRRFCKLLDAPPKDNPRLTRLMALTRLDAPPTRSAVIRQSSVCSSLT
ncbi:MAG: hypothetical protein DCC55_38760 [Chloroflexi bacterium]|nr:MAG: hypothetical protein DCC55_38760 [Chloroflexota bacterium]